MTIDSRKQELDHALIISRQIDYLGKMPAVTPKPVRTSKDPNYRDRIGQCRILREVAMVKRIRQIIVQEHEPQNDLATALGEEVPDPGGGPPGRLWGRRRQRWLHG